MDPTPTPNTVPMFYEQQLCSDIMDSSLNLPTSIPRSRKTPKLVEFLDTSPLFNSKKKEWRDIPKSPQRGRDLYKAMSKIFIAVGSEFVSGALRGLAQRTNDVEPVNVERSDKSTYSLRSKPPAMLAGSGPNFPDKEIPAKGCDPFCVVPFELQVEDDWDDVKLQVQVLIYARQCFMLQQNRKFVFVLVMSEITARLYQFDRTGLQQFRKFNYHKSALDFLRLVIGLLAADDEACGFDTSIFWKGDRRYIRNVHDKNGPFEYQLTSVNSSAEFTGIGTVRWLAQDVHGTSLIIEDTWPFADQESRDRLLDLIRGLDGVGEVLACEESFNTSQFREPGAADTSPIPPRVRCRIIFKEYKNSIDKFENRVEFLQALGDAVVGHRNLWKRGVLHRDISIDNIRIGRDGARTGNIGLLIGILHSSFVFEGSKKLELTDHRTSESRFQSILVASSCPTFEDYIPYNYAYESAPHDYLDDLESFFYVFVWICLGYEGPGRPHPPSLKRFSTWDEQGIFSAHAKRWLLSERTDGDWKVSPYFGPVFQALFRELRIFIGERLNTKMKAIRLFEWPRKPSDFQHVDDDYAMFLGFIDKALKGLQVEVLGEQRTSVISRFHFLPPQYAPPMAQVVRERNKRSHPNSKQPSDENVKAGMLSTGKQPLKHSQTEMRYDISHRNPPCWPLGTLR